MHTFYFNHECLPVCEDRVRFREAFEATLTAYDELAREAEANVFQGIITETLPSHLNLGGDFTLGDVIKEIPNGALRGLAYRYFTRYPIEDHLGATHQTMVSESELDEAGSFIWLCETEARRCFYLVLAGFHKGFAFSPSMEACLAIHLLELNDGAKSVEIPNLYGEESNLQAIREEINRRNQTFRTLFDQLLTVLGKCVLAPKFRKEFEQLRDSEKQSIIDMVERAKDRNLASPLFPDTKIIKDVSQQDGKCKVYELRVYTPTALRVYFLEKEGRVYLVSIKMKSNPNQTKDIQQAERLIHKLLLTDQ
jgi:putative component of toxin-antitoxin plasmid stabilization module